MGTPRPNTGTTELAVKAKKRVGRELGYVLKTATFYVRLRALDKHQIRIAEVAAGAPLQRSTVLEALAAIAGPEAAERIRANRAPQEVEPDDIWDMEPDEYESYLRRREGKDNGV